MTRIFTLLALVSLLSGCSGHRPAARRPDPTDTRSRTDVARVLDDLHDAASKAQGDRYFALFAPDAVFLGTDAAERWTLDQFKAYTLPLFSQGHGWSYTPVQRHTAVSPDGWAWFDELLQNQKYGTCRGSGLLRQSPAGSWLIVQYDLSVPIPNDLLPHISDEIREMPKPTK